LQSVMEIESEESLTEGAVPEIIIARQYLLPW
jgi:hypothetical protein